MNIDPRRLRYLLAVARSGGVLAAADVLTMTPSAVSQQIARLEREVGCVLVTRTPHGSELTAEGLVLAEAAQDIERTLVNAGARLRKGSAEIQGVMRLGGFQSFLSGVVAPLLPDWKCRLPGVQFDLVESDVDPLMRALETGELDAGIVELDSGMTPKALPRGMTEVPLLDEPWKLVVPAGTLVPDVSDLGSLGLQWLGTEPSTASSQAAERLCRAAGMELNWVHRYFSTQTGLALVAAHEGLAVIPMLALRGLVLDGVDTVDVPGLGTRRIALRSYFRGRESHKLITTVTALIADAVEGIASTSGVLETG
jgi:DNA-binding transcriptional LysR family regulator